MNHETILRQLVENATYEHGRGWLVPSRDFEEALAALGMTAEQLVGHDAIFGDPDDEDDEDWAGECAVCACDIYEGDDYEEFAVEGGTDLACLHCAERLRDDAADRERERESR